MSAQGCGRDVLRRIVAMVVFWTAVSIPIVIAIGNVWRQIFEMINPMPPPNKRTTKQMGDVVKYLLWKTIPGSTFYADAGLILLFAVIYLKQLKERQRLHAATDRFAYFIVL